MCPGSLEVGIQACRPGDIERGQLKGLFPVFFSHVLPPV
ncbi:hypothetical protein D187_003918 [Cystobacter fuscus DSM 2262]|uniref:Uncharacterized protein n=1 Tax=Cystobacter fuscus (strain ATCC 25194 / DSM 2262 / NBRC 100088 / M29) TaxID=1242864 RepID=S9P5G3_CYSF2|nr:hypothetical protein D187_003918 [Cystobacter fuscus DSM 2262]